jgi:hypothetical protein
MSKFGTTPTNNNPAFGNNPAAASDGCYSIIIIGISWRGDKVDTDTLGKLRGSIPGYVLAALWLEGVSLPDMGGSITKTCKCMSRVEAIKLGLALSKVSIPTPPKVKSNNKEALGYLMVERDCDCGGLFTRSKCVGHEEHEILGPGGQPLNINTGSWVTSTGDTRQFPGGNKKDILQDIINTETQNLLPCCSKDNIFPDIQVSSLGN